MAMTPIRRRNRGRELLRPYPGTLPLIGVGGSRGKTSVSLLLQHVLETHRQSTGSWTSAGVIADGGRMDGELHAWERCLLASRVGELDVIIQELPSALATAVPLPDDTYPLTIFTMLCGNDIDCKGMATTRREYLAVQRLAQATRPGGVMVVNADDRTLLDLAEDFLDREMVLYALHEANPALRQHIDAGGAGVWLDGTMIIYADSERTEHVADVRDFPSSLGGALTIVVQNALAASASAKVLDVPAATIKHALSTYTVDPQLLPGSCSLSRIRRTPAIFDRADRAWSLKSLIRSIKNIPARQRIVLYGNLAIPDVDLDEAGRLLASIPNSVLLANWPSNDEARHNALLAGMHLDGTPPLVIRCDSPQEAIARLCSHIGPDDLAVVLADDPLPYIDLLLD